MGAASQFSDYDKLLPLLIAPDRSFARLLLN
jgi:hypothetical protein